MPKLIEIIGSPGSGKSFLSYELEKIKKNNEQIFFHSGNYNKMKKMFILIFYQVFLLELK